MPPRKSDVTKVATGDEGTPAKEQLSRDGINVEDLNLPKSIVTRLAKGVLPPNTQIQGNAMLAMTKSATVFVNYLATHANDNATSQNRKTIAPQDVLKALEDLEFPEFRPRLEAELKRFNDIQTDKRNQYRKRVAADKESGKVSSLHGEDEETLAEVDMEGALDREGQPASKKARRETSDGTVEDISELRETDIMGDREDEEGDDDEGHGDDPEDEDDDDQEERLEVEEQLEDPEQREIEDEALDNGEDSD